ncbi:MAG: hypothetical protein AAGM22_25580, partial [Acidobacteriota bacterium]
MSLRNGFFALVFLCFSAPVFAFGSSGADCNGDGQNDISCSGISCRALDDGVLPDMGGFCDCLNADGSRDTKTCAELPTIAPASWHGEELPGLAPQLAVETEPTEKEREERVRIKVVERKRAS